jgi:hypothetical protein
MNKLIELSHTSKHIYSLVCLPKDAFDINVLGGHVISWWENSENTLLFTKEHNLEPLGLLNELKEEQAREIVYSRGSEQKYPFLNYMNVLYYFESALESLTSKVESNGISTTENKILILKAEI